MNAQRTVDVNDDYVARAALVKLEVDRLAREAQRPGLEPGRLIGIRREMEILVDSLREIRREQLRAQITRPHSGPSRRHWWTRGA